MSGKPLGPESEELFFSDEEDETRIAQSNELAVAFETALKAVDAHPENDRAWDRLEQLARLTQQPEPLVHAYRAALQKPLTPALGVALGKRAVLFCDEWLEEPEATIDLLERVLAFDGAQLWAFERISLPLMVEGQWDKLLDLYDQMLSCTGDLAKRVSLLQEAAHVAKDCAEQPDRAVGYLEQLFAFKPSDPEVGSALERLLKQQQRFEDLIGLWTRRLQVLPEREAWLTRQRIAQCWLEHLHNPARALEVLEPLLAQPSTQESVFGLLETILASPDADPAARRRALTLLSQDSDDSHRWPGVVRALEQALSFVDLNERVSLHREIARRLLVHGQQAGAMRHLAAWIAIDASTWTEERLSLLLTGRFREPIDGCPLTLDRDQGRQLLGQAAALSSREMQRPERAIELYQELLQDRPEDLGTIAQLGVLYAQQGHREELLRLRQHELSLPLSTQRRLELRREIAQHLQALHRVDESLKSLQENLREQAGDEPTIEALVSLLEHLDRPEEIIALLQAQASQVQALGRDPLAAQLWLQAARLLEAQGESSAQVIDCYRNVVALSNSAEALDALARLHEQQGAHGAAVPWLEQLLELSEGPIQAKVVARLARAHMQAGQPAQALSCLQQGLVQHPESLELRELLATLHQNAQDWESLLTVLFDSAQWAQDPSRRFGFLCQAAQVCQERLQAPDRTIPILQQAITLQPTDRAARTALARALRDSEHWEQARSLTISLIDEFGRRRCSERAALHLLLGQIAWAQGQSADALQQLEMAASIDLANEQVQRMLGDVYRELGQLEKAERAYHALLLILRRRRSVLGQSSAAGAPDISDALFELHRVAQALGATDRAAENLESAFDAACQSEEEARRFEKRLEREGYTELLLRALERRLFLTDTPRARAEILTQIANICDQSLGRLDQALDAQLRAVCELPTSVELLERAESLALRSSDQSHFGSQLQCLAEQALAQGNGPLACDLLLHLGTWLEREPSTFAQAASVYARAEDTGQRLPEIWQAMARLASRRQDSDGELQALQRLAELGPDSLSSAQRADVLYRLAELEVSDAFGVETGLCSLQQAIECDARPEMAAQVLQKLLGVNPGHAAAIELFEQMARASGKQSLLLMALRHACQHGGLSQARLKEAAILALGLGEQETAETLLSASIELAEEAQEPSQALWAMQLRAERLRSANQLREAVGWLMRAAELASPSQAESIQEEVAMLAAGPLQDLALAAELYGHLHQAHPENASFAKALLGVVRRLGDKAHLEQLLQAVAEGCGSSEQKRALLLERADVLGSLDGRQNEALSLVRALFETSPEQAEILERLFDLLAQAQQIEEISHLLDTQLELARGRNDGASAERLALRWGPVVAGADQDRARQLYGTVLAWLESSPALLQAQLALLDPVQDASERAELLERLLAQSQGQSCLPQLLMLIETRRVLGDPSRLEQALEQAYRLAPEDQQVQSYLRDFAEQLIEHAKTQPAPQQALVLLEKAATLYGERLRDAQAAASALEQAYRLVPSRWALVPRLVQYLTACGQVPSAVQLLSEVLERGSVPTSETVRLLRLRAGLFADSQQPERAVTDLEQALSLGDKQALTDLVPSLEQARDKAARTLDRASERACTLRLAQLAQRTGDYERARGLLLRWLEREPSDRETLWAYAELEHSSKHWSALPEVYGRLVQWERGEAQLQAVMRLAEVCEQLGRAQEARAGLELVFRQAPGHGPIRTKLRVLYEQAQAHRELASLLLVEAQYAEDNTQRFELLREAGRIRLSELSDSTGAVGPLAEALGIRPNDLEVTLLLADGYIAAGLVQEVVGLLQQAIEQQGGRRSRELAALQHRMARAAALGDRVNELSWLCAAYETYPQSAEVASELADLAIELGHYDIALKALRTLTTMKNTAANSRASAFLKQARIAHLQGDDRKALLLARKAQSEDPETQEAGQFIQELGAV